MKKVIASCIAAFLICVSAGRVQADVLRPFDCKHYVGEENCLKSDFDGNGVNDYVAPQSEGWIKVYMNFGTESEKVIDIDAGGVAELYAPRNAIGKNGEPISKHPSILIQWVGQNHVVFMWNGDTFKKVTFPGFYEER